MMGVQGVFELVVLNLVTILSIFFIGLILGRILGRILTLILIEYDAEKVFKKFGGTSFAFFLGGLLSYIIYFIALVMILNYLGVRQVTSVIFSGAILLLFFAAAFLGVKDFFSNVFYNFAQQKSFKKGDSVIFSGLNAKVIGKDLTKIKLMTTQGDIFLIPNSGIEDADIKKSNGVFKN